MELAVHGKQMDVGDALRSHVKAKMDDLTSKYFNHTTYATVTFSRDGHGHKQTKAHIMIKLGRNILIVADATEMDPRVAFDFAAERAAKQLRRYKTRLRDHHQRIEASPDLASTNARDYVLASVPDQDNDEDDGGVPQGEDPVVIAEMSTSIQTMSVADAVMRLDLSGQPALLFYNASHNGVNMVYRRADGNIGWLDPENKNCKQAKAK